MMNMAFGTPFVGKHFGPKISFGVGMVIRHFLVHIIRGPPMSRADVGPTWIPLPTTKHRILCIASEWSELQDNLIS